MAISDVVLGSGAWLISAAKAHFAAEDFHSLSDWSLDWAAPTGFLVRRLFPFPAWTAWPRAPKDPGGQAGPLSALLSRLMRSIGSAQTKRAFSSSGASPRVGEIARRCRSFVGLGAQDANWQYAHKENQRCNGPPRAAPGTPLLSDTASLAAQRFSHRHDSPLQQGFSNGPIIRTNRAPSFAAKRRFFLRRANRRGIAFSASRFQERYLHRADCADEPVARLHRQDDSAPHDPRDKKLSGARQKVKEIVGRLAQIEPRFGGTGWIVRGRGSAAGGIGLHDSGGLTQTAVFPTQ